MMSTLCMQQKQKLEEAIAAYNKAYKDKDVDGMAKASEAASKAAGEYADQAGADLISAHKDDADPVAGVLKEGFFGTYKASSIRQNGVVIGLELTEGERQVNLKKLFEYHQKPIGWKSKIENLTEVLVEATCTDVNVSTAGIREKFKMSAEARKETIPANPTSNSSMLKLLQAAVDAIVFDDDGKGANKYRVNNYDLKFVKHCFTKEGKGRIDIETAKWQRVTNIICKVLYRILNGYAYNVNFKIVEQSDSLEAQRAANRAAKAAKADKKAKAEAEKPADEPVVVAREEVAEAVA